MAKLDTIRSVSGAIKGRTWDEVHLAPKTFLLGPNRAGKTSLLNLIELSLEGAASDVGMPAKPWVKAKGTLGTKLAGPDGKLEATVTWTDGTASTYEDGKQRGPQGAPFRELWDSLSRSPNAAREALFAVLKDTVDIDPTVLFDESILPLLDPDALQNVATLEARRRELVKELKAAQSMLDQRKALLLSIPVEAPDVEAAEAALDDALRTFGAGSVEDAIELDRAQREAKAAGKPVPKPKPKPKPAAPEDDLRTRRGEALLTLLPWQAERVKGKGRQACLLCDGALPSRERLIKMHKAAKKLAEG